MDGSTAIAQAELLTFIERIEAQRARVQEEKDAEKEIFEELASRGYMKRPVRTVLKLRAMSADDRAEEEAILDMYKAAVGL